MKKLLLSCFIFALCLTTFAQGIPQQQLKNTKGKFVDTKTLVKNNENQFFFVSLPLGANLVLKN